MRAALYPSTFVLASLLCASCAALQPLLEPEIKPPMPLYELGVQVPESLPDGAPAVVLVDERRLEHWSPPKALITQLDVHRAVLVLKPEGLGLAKALIRAELGGTFADLQARTVLPDGRVIRVERAQIREVKLGGRGRKAFAKAFSFPQVVQGAVLEYRYTLLIPGYVGAFRHQLEVDLPVEHATFEALVLDNMQLRSEARGFEGPQISERGRGRMYRWSLSFEQLQEEVLQLSVPRRAPMVHFAVSEFKGTRRSATQIYRSWNEVLTPLWQRVRGSTGRGKSQTPPIDVRRKVVQEVWRQVQTAIEDRPSTTIRSAREVVSSRYGSANERAVVMLARLRSQRFNAGMAWVPKENQEDFKRVFPAPVDGTALMVLLVRDQGEQLLLDPSCRGCKPGELSPQYQGRRAVALQPKNLASSTNNIFFLYTPVDRSLSSYKHAAQLGDEGFVLNGQWTLKGARAAKVRHRLMTKSAEMNKEDLWLQQILFAEELRAGALKMEGLLDPIRLSLNKVVVSAKGVLKARDRLSIPVRALKAARPELTLFFQLREVRESPVYLPEGLSFEQEVRLQIPEGYQVASLPKDSKPSCKWGTYALNVVQKEGEIFVYERLQLQERLIPVDDYPTFFEFIRDVRKARQSTLLFKATSAQPQEPQKPQESQEPGAAPR